MKPDDVVLAEMFRKDACACLNKYLPRIVRCVELLGEDDIWWRANPASNSAGNTVTGLKAVSSVYEHFSYHAGQIIYLTKLKRGEDLHFTRLPDYKPKG